MLKTADRLSLGTAVSPDALRRWLPLAALVLGAVALRVVNVTSVVTFYPDSYAQLQATDNLLSGDFPIGYYYPPGVAVALAPFFLVLPDTLVTMQFAIASAGIALVLLAYFIPARWLDDRRAGLFFAAAVALSVPFVIYSRVVWFDIINTLLIAVSLVLAPAVARRGTGSLVLYGVLVFTTVTIRYTNIIILPALLLASLPDAAAPLTVRRVLAHVRSRAVFTVGLVFAALMCAYIATAHETFTRLGNDNGGSVIDLAGYVPRVAHYVWVSLAGYGVGAWPVEAVVVLTVLGLAIVGGRHLWVARPDFARPVFLLLIVWAPAHAPYEDFSNRYALPMVFFVLLLASIGLSELLRSLPEFTERSRAVVGGLVAIGLVVAIGWHAAVNGIVITTWPPGDLSSSREAAYDDIRTYLARLDAENVTVYSSQALAIDQANDDVSVYDLVRHANEHGINQTSAAQLADRVQDDLARGRVVYYHYSDFEDDPDRFARFEQGFDVYFAAIDERLPTRRAVTTVREDQRLYLIEP